MDREIVLRLLRTAMLQWAAFLEIELAIEAAIGFEGDCEVRNYVQELAPDFLDRPESLTTEHTEPLLRLRDTRPLI
jgi:hypothetical protein